MAGMRVPAGVDRLRARGGGVLVCLGLGLAASPARGQGYSGTYEASPARVTANVETWGKDCGVRPKTYALQERPSVPVTDNGKHLQMRFPSGTLRSDRCWSQNPTLTLESTEASQGRWRTRCATPEGEPKSEKGLYEIVARDGNRLELTESSRYDWQLKESHCVATVRIVRTLTREPAPGAEPPAAPKPEPQERNQAPQPECVPGTLAKLWITPSRMRAEPGQRVCFSARAADADGCRIPQPNVRWSVSGERHARGDMHGHCFKSAASAAEGEGRFRVTARSGAVSAHARVRVQTPDLSDITAHNVLAEAHPLAEDFDDPIEPRGAAAETGVAARTVQSQGFPWAAVAAGLAMLAALGAWLAMRRRPAAATRAPSDLEAPNDDDLPEYGRPTMAADSDSPAGAAAIGARRPSASTEPMICPQCRRGYAPTAQRCESDGTTLMPYKQFNAQADTARARTCASCGALFKSDTAFCGKCGARLA